LPNVTVLGLLICIFRNADHHANRTSSFSSVAYLQDSGIIITYK